MKKKLSDSIRHTGCGILCQSRNATKNAGLFDGGMEYTAANKRKPKWTKIRLAAVSCSLVLSVLISATGCGSQKNTSTTTTTNDDIYSQEVTSKASKSKTVMIYMVGSDLESENGVASLDISEMLNSGVMTEKNNILLYTGGTKEWKISEIPTDKNSVFLLQDEDFVPVQSFESLDMGESATLTEFLKYGVENYKADEYGLILWDHGAGPLIGYGLDEIHNDILEMSELDTALKDAGFCEGNKLEFLGFDACLMGSVETAWIVKDYAEYLIASQETEPGCGWDYSFLKRLDNYDSGKDIGSAIVDYYIAGYEKLVKEYPKLESDVTLSCMKLSQIGNLEASLNELFAQVDENILDGYFPQASKHRNDTKAFGKFSSSYNYDLIDMGHIVSLLADDYKTEADNFQKALNDFVVYSKANVANTSGVSIYHPYDNTEIMDYWIESFKNLGFAEKYAQYISDFGALLGNSNATEWKTFTSAQGSAVTKSSAAELSIQLTAEQAANYACSNYYILKKLNDDEYLFVFSGIDTQLNTAGVLSATYNDKAVFSVNDKTNAVSETPITMYQVRDGGTDIKYYASAIFWDYGDDIAEWKVDPVEWQIKMTDGTPQTLSAFLIEGVNGESIPQKQLLNYEEYDTVEFSFSTRTPKYDDAGNLLSYFQWDSTGKFYGQQYNVADGFHLECRDIDNSDGEYFAMFTVRDVYGNVYTSEMFSLPN